MAYETPTAAQLAARFPAFAGVPPETIDVHIADAVAMHVDTSWKETDYPIAAMAYAAHAMALLNIGDHGEVEEYAKAGVSSIKSGNFSASFDGAKVSAAAAGGLNATVYGRQYKLLLLRNRGGARVVSRNAAIEGDGAVQLQNNGVRWPWVY